MATDSYRQRLERKSRMEHLGEVAWMSSLFDKLLVMQSNNILCDAVIECDDCKKVPVHSCVLAAASPVFQQALADLGPIPIGQQKVLAGQGFSEHVWTLLVKFVYSGQLEVDLDDSEVNSLADAASKMSIVTLEEKVNLFKTRNVLNTVDIKEESSEIIASNDESFPDLNHSVDAIEIVSKSDHCDLPSVKIEDTTNSKEKQAAKCKQCDQTFLTSDLLLEHCKENHWKYKCTHCDKWFEKRSGLVRHEAMVHVQTQKEHKCKHCDYATKKSALYLVHLKKHKQYKCTHCPYEGKSKLSLMSHLKEAHQFQKLYKCSYKHCSYSSNSEGSIKVHEMTVHTTDRSFKCQVCSKLFKTQTDLNRHFPVHRHDYVCDQCDASFARKFSLEDHKRKKHNAEPLTCPECEILFTSVPLRSKHIREVHQGRITKYKRCPCKLCGKVVTSMGELRRHMRVHTGEKLYPCDSCSRSFATKNDLLNHQMIHTGEKPFLCAYCPFKCNRQYNLRVHEKKHARERESITCYICQPTVSFRCMEDFDKHKRKKHQDIVNDDLKKNDDGVFVGDATLNENYEIMVLADEQDTLQTGQEIQILNDQIPGSSNAFTENAIQMFISDGKILTYDNTNQSAPIVLSEDPQNQLLQFENYIESCSEIKGEEAGMLTYVEGGECLEEQSVEQRFLDPAFLQGDGQTAEVLFCTNTFSEAQDGSVVLINEQQ